MPILILRRHRRLRGTTPARHNEANDLDVSLAEQPLPTQFISLSAQKSRLRLGVGPDQRFGGLLRARKARSAAIISTEADPPGARSLLGDGAAPPRREMPTNRYPGGRRWGRSSPCPSWLSRIPSVLKTGSGGNLARGFESLPRRSVGVSAAWLSGLRRCNAPTCGTSKGWPISRNRLFWRRDQSPNDRPADRPERTATRRRPVPSDGELPDAFGPAAGSLDYGRAAGRAQSPVCERFES